MNEKRKHKQLIPIRSKRLAGLLHLNTLWALNNFFLLIDHTKRSFFHFGNIDYKDHPYRVRKLPYIATNPTPGGPSL